MSQNPTTKTLRIEGMTCVSCENRIERKLTKTKGISSVQVSYKNGTARITFDADVIGIGAIEKTVESLDYKVIKAGQEVGRKSSATQVLGVIAILYAAYIILQQFGSLNIFNSFPEAEKGMGYGMLFAIGMLTSVHCVAMCGGISLSQCIPNAGQAAGSTMSSLRPSFLYNLGRVISYTIVGGFVGAIGSVVSFSGYAKGIVQLAAGVFMVIMGLNMLNVFPCLRKLAPRMPRILSRKIGGEKTKSNSPLYVGLLNGFMPCGPLQAMQLYALSTGGPIKGAISMLLFSLGTVPLMFGLGALSSVLTKKFTSRMMTVGAALVVVLGISMFQSGMILSSVSFSVPATGVQQNNLPKITDGIQIVTTKLSPGKYEPITVQAGVPVQWTIQAEAGTINGCNNRIIISAYNLEKKLEVGDNVIEFTPTESGTVPFSCWMGMIRSTITVVGEGEGEVGALPPDTSPNLWN